MISIKRKLVNDGLRQLSRAEKYSLCKKPGFWNSSSFPHFSLHDSTETKQYSFNEAFDTVMFAGKFEQLNKGCQLNIATALAHQNAKELGLENPKVFFSDDMGANYQMLAPGALALVNGVFAVTTGSLVSIGAAALCTSLFCKTAWKKYFSNATLLGCVHADADVVILNPIMPCELYVNAIAHEVRHIHQNNMEDPLQKKKNSFISKLITPYNLREEEIDANQYAEGYETNKLNEWVERIFFER